MGIPVKLQVFEGPLDLLLHLIEKNKINQVSQSINLSDNISAPISAGQKLGEATFSLDDKIVASVNLVAESDVPKLNLFTMSKRVIYSWVDLLRS